MLSTGILSFFILPVALLCTVFSSEHCISGSMVEHGMNVNSTIYDNKMEKVKCASLSHILNSPILVCCRELQPAPLEVVAPLIDKVQENSSCFGYAYLKQSINFKIRHFPGVIAVELMTYGSLFH